MVVDVMVNAILNWMVNLMVNVVVTLMVNRMVNVMVNIVVINASHVLNWAMCVNQGCAKAPEDYLQITATDTTSVPSQQVRISLCGLDIIKTNISYVDDA